MIESVGIGRLNPERVEHPALDEIAECWRRSSLAPSAAAITTRICSRTRTTRAVGRCALRLAWLRASAGEAPECCKRLSGVLAHHGNTVRVLHVLRPIGVAMAGLDESDPFKD